MKKCKTILALDKLNKIKNKEYFVQLWENVINQSDIYDRRLFKEKFKKIYNNKDNIFNFSINDRMFSNIIIKWKKNNIRFTKASILVDSKDYEGMLILKEYRIISINEGIKNFKKIL